MKLKFILLTSFFGLAGIFAIFIAIKTFLTGTGLHGQNMLVPNTDNYILKYCIGFTFLSLSIPALAMAILPYKGILTLDYHNAPKHLKVKNNVILGTLIIPFCLLMAQWIKHQGFENNYWKSLIILAGLLFIVNYINDIATLIKHNKNNT